MESANRRGVHSSFGLSSLARAQLGLLLVGSSLSLLSLAGVAQAQSAVKLDPLKVEAQGAKKKKAAAAKTGPTSPTTAAPQLEQPPVSPERAQQDAPYRTPASVSTVTYGDLQTYGQMDTGDVLRSFPGTSTRESTNNPGIAVNIRGFEGSGRVNMTIDGVRQNFRFTGHEAQGFAYVDPALLAGIDIQRGAVSTAGGAGALAGTANFRTLDVGDIIKPGQTAGALTNVSWGTNNAGWSEMVAAGVTNGHVGFAGAISKHDPGNYDNGDGIEVPYTEQDLTSGLFKAEFKLSDEQKLKFGAVIYDNEFLANTYPQDLRSETFTASYSYNPVSTDLVNLKANLYRSNVTMNYDSTPLIPGGGGSAGREIDDEGIGFDVTNVSKFHPGDVRVRSEYGYESFYDDVNVINSALVPDRGVNPSGESSIQGVFSQTTFSHGIFDLIGGLRYDRFKVDGEGSVTAGNPIGMPPGPYVVDVDEGRWNPKVTLAATPWHWLQPYVTYAEAFRAPTVSELLTGGVHPATGGPPMFFYPNPFLEPEISKGWDFGANFVVDGLLTRNDRFRFKADYYMQDVENYITACFGPMGQIYYCNNPGISQVQGVELQGDYDAGFAFAGLAYTYTDSDLPSQVNGFGAQSYLPDHVLTLTGGLRFLDERLVVGAKGYIVSGAYIGEINTPAGQPPFTEGYELLDLYANYQTNYSTTLGVTVTNVFDRAYTPELSTGASGGFTGDTGRGRTALFTVRSQF